MEVKIDAAPVPRYEKSFLGVEILYREFNPPTSPSSTALAVGPCEWGALRVGDPGNARP